MTKQEHIEYWLNTSKDDFDVFNVLLANHNYLHAFFIAHLCIEKLVKTHWVKDNDNNIPPKVHNLVNLTLQIKLELTKEQMKFLAHMNDFQIQGRYPDYKLKIKKMLTKKYVENIVPKLFELRLCLIEKMA